MTLLTTFLLVGTVDSKDDFFATVEVNLNPPLEKASMAIMPISAFPCEIKEGDSFYILKLTKESLPVIICKDKEETKSNDGER